MSAKPGGPQQVALFRLRFGGESGWGHLARCSALATELRKRGWICRLWGDPVPNNAPADFDSAFDDCLPAHAEASAAWVVVDDYDCSDEILRVLKTSVGLGGARFLVMDDDCQRSLDAADIIVNSRLGLGAASPYTTGVRALVGERYALLRSGLKMPSAVNSDFPAGTSGVLVLLGGTDPRSWTAEVLHGLADVEGGRFAPIVVLSKSASGAEKVVDALKRFENSAWVESADAAALAGWSRCCDHAVSAAGGSLLELAFLKVPFVSLIAADNQSPLALEACARWGMPFVEDPQSVRSSVATLIKRLPPATAFGSAVDGRGVERVAKAMGA